MPPKTISVKESPAYPTEKRIDFINGVAPFEAAVDNKSYRLIWEKGLRCPCRLGNNMDVNLHSCTNCRGYGYVFVNPTVIRGMGYDINSKNTYQDWSIDNMGILKFSLSAETRPTFMDRITIVDGTSVNTEIQTTMANEEGFQFIYTIYQPVNITDIRIYESLEEPLRQLSSDDVEITSYAIIFKTLKRISNVSVRYEHAPQYMVIDTPHEIRNISTMIDGREENPTYPVNVVAKKAHYIFDTPNIYGDSVNDNSTI